MRWIPCIPSSPLQGLSKRRSILRVRRFIPILLGIVVGAVTGATAGFFIGQFFPGGIAEFAQPGSPIRDAEAERDELLGAIAGVVFGGLAGGRVK
jgi:membrane protein YqaA with SNARE-associated domain